MKVIRQYYCDSPKFLEKAYSQNDFLRRAEIRERWPGEFRLVTYFPKAKLGEVAHAEISQDKCKDPIAYLEDVLNRLAEKQGYKIVLVHAEK